MEGWAPRNFWGFLACSRHGWGPAEVSVTEQPLWGSHQEGLDGAEEAEPVTLTPAHRRVKEVALLSRVCVCVCVCVCTHIQVCQYHEGKEKEDFRKQESQWAVGGCPARGTATFRSHPTAMFCHPLCRYVGREEAGCWCLLLAPQAPARCFIHMTSFSPPPLFLVVSVAMTAFRGIKQRGGDLLSSLHSVADPQRGMWGVWVAADNGNLILDPHPRRDHHYYPPPILGTFPACSATQEAEAAASAHPRSCRRGTKTWKANVGVLAFLPPSGRGPGPGVGWALWCLGLLTVSGITGVLTVGAEPLRPRDLMETCRRLCPQTQPSAASCSCFFYQLGCFGLQVAKQNETKTNRNKPTNENKNKKQNKRATGNASSCRHMSVLLNERRGAGRTRWGLPPGDAPGAQAG